MTFLPEIALAFRFAIREMRQKLKGFYIFIVCIALGVAAIGGVSSLSKNIEDEISRQGQVILGGDIRFSLTQREANTQELQFFKNIGEVSSSIRLRTSVRRLDNAEQSMVEVKAVDSLYPLYGRVKTVNTQDGHRLFSTKETQYSAIAPQILLDRLGLKIGDHLMLGTIELVVSDVLLEEPDLLSEGFQLAPRLIVAKNTLEAAHLLQPGSLYSSIYKIAAPNLSDTELSLLKQKIADIFPNAAWNVRVRSEAASGFVKNMERFSQFLSLIGLTALFVGGIGVANAVRSYMEKKRLVIAIFKSMGASGRMVVAIYLLQILCIATIAIFFGLLLAIALPFATTSFLRQFLPFLTTAHIYPSALLMAIIFAYFIVLTFSYLPLMQAKNVAVNIVFRSLALDMPKIKQKYPFLIGIILFALMAFLAILQSYDKLIAVIFFIFMFLAFLILRLLSLSIQFFSYRMRAFGSIAWRLALGNIYRKGALTPSIVLALGLGLTLLVALATIDGNLRQQLSSSVPDSAPDFFFLDITRSEADNFTHYIKEIAPNSQLTIVPNLRARITKLNGVDVNDVKVHPDGAWVLRGERNITYAQDLPKNSTLIEGQWWGDGEESKNQVSISKQEAIELGLHLDDTITINVLGQEITAKITSFREVNWNSFAMNFVLIFSPQTLRGAPHVFLATLKADETQKIDEAGFLRGMAQRFPTVTAVSVRQVLQDAKILVDQIALAMRGAASIALLSSIFVLAGALSAGNHARSRDAVILKICGATRFVLIKAFIYEYAILGAVTAFFAIIVGSIIGVSIAYYKMELVSAHILLSTAFAVLIIGLVLSVGLGLIGTWHILGQKASKYLRS